MPADKVPSLWHLNLYKAYWNACILLLTYLTSQGLQQKKIMQHLSMECVNSTEASCSSGICVNVKAALATYVFCTCYICALACVSLLQEFGSVPLIELFLRFRDSTAVHNRMPESLLTERSCTWSVTWHTARPDASMSTYWLLTGQSSAIFWCLLTMLQSSCYFVHVNKSLEATSDQVVMTLLMILAAASCSSLYLKPEFWQIWFV